jgi:hypothetical protein
LINFPYLFFYFQIIFRLSPINDEILFIYQHFKNLPNPITEYKVQSQYQFVQYFFHFLNLLYFMNLFIQTLLISLNFLIFKIFFLFFLNIQPNLKFLFLLNIFMRMKVYKQNFLIFSTNHLLFHFMKIIT